MANFTKVLYVAGDGKKYKIRMSTADVTAQPTAPGTGAADVAGTVKVSKNSKAFGLRPRRLSLTRTAGTAPNVKTYYDRLIVCAAADVATLQTAGTVTINSVVWTVGNLIGEGTR